MTDAIIARHLRKRYGAVQAVADVSFTVTEGEVVCLLGPNGAGKSTTTRILTTLTRADGGSATVAGHDVTAQPQSVRATVGYIAQHAGTDAYLTGRENLLVQSAAQGLRRAVAKRRAAELLDRVHLTSAADRLVATYSGGMRRRLEIVMGMVHNPSVIFLDEPTTGLDPEARADLWSELNNLGQQQSLTVLLTTHYLEEADRLADRVVIIDRGRVIAEGAPEVLKSRLAGDSVTVEVAGRPATQDILAAIREVDSRAVSVAGNRVVAHVQHGSHALPAIVTGLEATGLHVTSASVTRPSLDDVYLHYTGRRLTDDNTRPDRP
ncbi:ATP-binding cassette domain-containing protein [Microlunatus soli]|uniref:ABC-2 type transport system ATP-binding protein n=1 Tax=Microlunatus soli TaxID=630515 RepID=A0A1H1SSL8_9ACTN|nr:ATP-binding cassette domain-containing protein [Microlunatus soli]SDS50921.1 ABC-2 type transport system ATP-binding protein [Microlunatus soli]